MAIPDFQSLMLPMIETLSDQGVWRLPDLEEALAKRLDVTNEEREQLLPSGSMPMFYNRVGWAKWHLERAKLVETVKRGHYRITDRGRKVLEQHPTRIDLRFLDQFPEHQNRNAKTGAQLPGEEVADAPLVQALSPEELIDSAHKAIHAELASALLIHVKSGTPLFFERLVIQLLIRMGYGGSRQEAGRAVGKSGDGGIDGIINEDRLGLDAIYLQAKRWEGVVGRPEIMKFVGALAGQRATKGVFITTSGFTQEAKEYAATSQYKVVLIDGPRLADLMIEHDLGVSVAATYQLKRIDSDFFADE